MIIYRSSLEELRRKSNLKKVKKVVDKVLKK